MRETKKIKTEGSTGQLKQTMNNKNKKNNNNKMTKRKMPGWEKIIWNKETKNRRIDEGIGNEGVK